MYAKLIDKSRIKELNPERDLNFTEELQVIRLRHWPRGTEETLVSFEEKHATRGWLLVSAASVRSETINMTVRQHIARQAEGRRLADADKELIPPGRERVTIKTFESTINQD